ncbi:MAG: AAA family ATPase [Uliginosibacterium sp.]|nr:AAA family ATPase [Uliginosibacterium sp.]
MRIHILGASGSGTSTLGRALAEALPAPFFDSDDFYWEPTEPPYRTPRTHDARRAALVSAVEGLPSWIVAGSMMGWGDALIPAFDLVVYLAIPPEIRLARLRAREQARFGDRLARGGDMHADHADFMDWAARYDTGGLDIRSRASHARWMTLLGCPVLPIEGDLSTEARLTKVSAMLSASPRATPPSPLWLAERRDAHPDWPSE